MAMARCDAFFDNVLGVPAEGWTWGGSVSPEAGLDGRATVFYASGAEAARAHTVLKSRAFPATVPEPIGDFIASLPASVAGSRLHIDVRLTKADFASIDVAALQEMTREMRGAD